MHPVTAFWQTQSVFFNHGQLSSAMVFPYLLNSAIRSFFSCTSGNFVLVIVNLFLFLADFFKFCCSSFWTFPFYSYTLGGFKMDDSLAGSLSNLCMVYWFHDGALHLTYTQSFMFIGYMPLACNLDCPSEVSVVCKTYEGSGKQYDITWKSSNAVVIQTPRKSVTGIRQKYF